MALVFYGTKGTEGPPVAVIGSEEDFSGNRSAATCGKTTGYTYLPTSHNGQFSVAIRAVYWQESSDTCYNTVVQYIVIH